MLHSGQIGLVKIIKTSAVSEGTRIEFKCGKRALTDYSSKHDIISKIANSFSVDYHLLDQAIAKIQNEMKDLRKKFSDQEQQLLQYEAQDIAKTATAFPDFQVILHIDKDRSASALKILAKKLAGSPKTVVLLASLSPDPTLIFSRSSDIELDMVPLLRETVLRLGGKGAGGSPNFAQGGISPAGREQVQTALEQLIKQIRS